jgi:hypothetical protein
LDEEAGYLMSIKLVGLLLLVGGIISLYSGLKKSRLIKDSKNWPTALGKVVTSNYYRRRTFNEIAPGAWMKEYYYEIWIKYDYSISGKTYTSERICVDKVKSVNSSDEAEDFIEEYPRGGSVTVYYDPTNPRLAILELSEEDNNFTYLFSIAMLVIGVFILIGNV